MPSINGLIISENILTRQTASRRGRRNQRKTTSLIKSWRASWTRQRSRMLNRTWRSRNLNYQQLQVDHILYKDICKCMFRAAWYECKTMCIFSTVSTNDLRFQCIMWTSERNPLIPAFSESAAIFFDPEKGRMMKARRDIKVS